MYIAEVLNPKCGFDEVEVGVFKLNAWDLEIEKAEVLSGKNPRKYNPYPHKDRGYLEQVGVYKRNYGAFYNTFWAFPLRGKWFALYSSDYTATRVMSLPDCKDIGGEKPDSFGFCPVDLFVPYLDSDLLVEGVEVDFGFVSGCIWGDDTNWKLRYIDLSNIEKGTISVEERFGYIELPYNQEIKNAVSFCRYEKEHQIIVVNTPMSFLLKYNKDKFGEMDYMYTEVNGYGLNQWKNVEDL